MMEMVNKRGHLLLLDSNVSGSKTHLAHLAFAVSSEEGHVVDLIHHNKVLFLTLEILQSKIK